MSLSTQIFFQILFGIKGQVCYILYCKYAVDSEQIKKMGTNKFLVIRDVVLVVILLLASAVASRELQKVVHRAVPARPPEGSGP